MSDGANAADARAEADVLVVQWADGSDSRFHWIWLRDACRCSACGAYEKGFRTSKVSDIPDDITAEAVRIDGADVIVDWPDGHESRYAGSWLLSNAYDEASRRARAFVPRPWTESIRSDPPRFAFDGVMVGDRAFLDMLYAVRDHGICVIDGAPCEAGWLERLATKVGPIQESNFGRIQDLVIDLAKGEVAQSAVALRPHTDEPYRASPPGILMFHCIQTDVEGAGQSLFVDGFEIAEVLRREDPDGFQALASHGQLFRRHFDGAVDVIAEFPILSLDAFGNLTGVRINDRVAGPANVPTDAVPVYFRGLKRLAALVEEPRYQLRYTLRPGDIAVFDNHRVLHGRTELTLSGPRWLQWAQVERGDFHSALRIVADRLGLDRSALPLMRGAYG